MLERELRDTCHIRRWGIVRTHTTQNVAEHSYLVTHYANDIGVWLGLDTTEQLALLQMALWHDVDEIFTGDIPGPAKRRTIDKEKMDTMLDRWMNKVFSFLGSRRAEKYEGGRGDLLHAILKLADEIEGGCFLGNEAQMGNTNVRGIMDDNRERVDKWLVTVCNLAALDTTMRSHFREMVHGALWSSKMHLSKPPSKEMIGL